MHFCVVLCIVCFVSFPVLFLCIRELTYCHWVATQLQLNISYHIYHIINFIGLQKCHDKFRAKYQPLPQGTEDNHEKFRTED